MKPHKNRARRVSALICIFAGLSAFLIGCATSRLHPAYGEKQLTPLADEVAGLKVLNCAPLARHKVFVEFTTNQNGGAFLEDYDFVKRRTNKISYEGNVAEDLKRKLEEVLVDYCRAVIVVDRTQADHTIAGRIIRYASQVVKAGKSGDESAWNFGGEVEMDFEVEFSTILTISSLINNNEWNYDHLMRLRKARAYKHHTQGSSLLMNKKVDIMQANKFILDYDGVFTLSTGVLVQTTTLKDVLLLTAIKLDASGSLEVYDIDTMEVRKRVTVDNADFPDPFHSWTNRTTKEYFDMYSTPTGNFKYLIYDYIKQAVSCLSRAASVQRENAPTGSSSECAF